MAMLDSTLMWLERFPIGKKYGIHVVVHPEHDCDRQGGENASATREVIINTVFYGATVARRLTNGP
jgi:hypothetical protein